MSGRDMPHVHIHNTKFRKRSMTTAWNAKGRSNGILVPCVSESNWNAELTTHWSGFCSGKSGESYLKNPAANFPAKWHNKTPSGAHTHTLKEPNRANPQNGIGSMARFRQNQMANWNLKQLRAMAPRPRFGRIS